MADSTNNPLQQPFAQVCAELTQLHTKKNHDYGNAFGDTYQEFVKNQQQKMADGYAIGLLCNKVNRVKTLLQNDAWIKEESIEDSLLDLASYAIMTIIERRRKP